MKCKKNSYNKRLRSNKKDKQGIHNLKKDRIYSIIENGCVKK